MLFTHCFANPACSPSRAEINTGKYQAFAGIKHVLTHWIFSKKDLELLGGYNQKLGQA
jgi:arylsulfatase A-like enzyme